MHTVPTGRLARPRTAPTANPERMQGTRIRTLHRSSKGGAAAIGDHKCGRDGRPQDIRTFLGLGPGRAEPRSPTGAADGAGEAGKPVKPKAKRTPGGPAGQRARKPRTLPEPSGDPKSHIHRWLVRGVTGESTGQDGAPELPGGPRDRSPGNCRPLAGCGAGPQPGPSRLPEAPGSSIDPPPPGCLRPGPRGIPTPTPGGQG